MGDSPLYHMDPVSALASVITLVDSVVVVGKGLIELCREVKNTPEDLHRLAIQILALSSTLDQQLRFLRDHANDLAQIDDKVARDGDVDTLRIALKKAEEYLGVIQETMIKYKGRPNKKTCLRWVIKDKRPILRLLDHLHQIERSLSDILTTISTFVSLPRPLSLGLF